MFRASTPTSETEGAVVRVCTIPVTVCACTCIKVTRVILIFCCLILCSHATLNRRSRAAPGAHLGTHACTNLVHTWGHAVECASAEAGQGAARRPRTVRTAHTRPQRATVNSIVHAPVMVNHAVNLNARVHTQDTAHTTSHQQVGADLALRAVPAFAETASFACVTVCGPALCMAHRAGVTYGRPLSPPCSELLARSRAPKPSLDRPDRPSRRHRPRHSTRGTTCPPPESAGGTPPHRA